MSRHGRAQTGYAPRECVSSIYHTTRRAQTGYALRGEINPVQITPRGEPKKGMHYVGKSTFYRTTRRAQTGDALRGGNQSFSCRSLTHVSDTLVDMSIYPNPSLNIDILRALFINHFHF